MFEDAARPIVTDAIYFDLVAGNSASGIGELEIAAQKRTAHYEVPA